MARYAGTLPDKPGNAGPPDTDSGRPEDIAAPDIGGIGAGGTPGHNA